jgi:hypothetical protein
MDKIPKLRFKNLYVAKLNVADPDPYDFTSLYWIRIRT